jgi:hypothetical protein
MARPDKAPDRPDESLLRKQCAHPGCRAYPCFGVQIAPGKYTWACGRHRDQFKIEDGKK